MKDLRLLTAMTVVMAGIATTATAQQPPAKAPLARADVAATVGWLNVRTSDFIDTPYDAWHNGGVEADGIFGWYWTDHVKTEVAAGRSTTGTVHAFQEFQSTTQFVYRPLDYTITATHVAVVQQYQFRRNVFFHPYVGAGVDFGWETLSGTAQPAFAYLPGAGMSTEVKPAQALGPESRFRARWLAETGFKAYLSQRAFFRSDLRFMGAGRLDSVLLRFGFGVDF